MARCATLTIITIQSIEDPVFVICLIRQVAKAGAFVVCGPEHCSLRLALLANSAFIGACKHMTPSSSPHLLMPLDY
jgi:hypothetical protein